MFSYIFMKIFETRPRRYDWGINLLTGGDFNEHGIIAAIKTSGWERRVKHRKLILPQLAASGIDCNKIKNLTGWQIEFGPVFARDATAFIRQNFQKTADQCLVKYPFAFRLEMLLSMNSLVWLAFAMLMH